MNCGLGIKYGLGIKRGLRTADCGLGIKYGLRTNLTYNGSAAKCHSTTTQYRQLAS